MKLNANHPTDKEQEFQSMVLDADKEREVQSMVLDTEPTDKEQQVQTMVLDTMPTDKTLKAIRYIRGTLQLIDQRKLPTKTVYLDIKDAESGWKAMWDMVVWGAQAIAFVAALSLAVEVANAKDFNGTSKDAATHLQSELDFFVSSWPIVVNIENVAEKLKEIVSNAVATATVPGDVFQAYIEAAENMFLEDVASNKAIGSYGASFLQIRLENPKRFSVLTHANAGSLATTGYGTALSIIRALHADGVLETAYCTETRPSNQGSRLTAFELVHENINATLITDSAAGALMKERRVSAVIVGAVSVAANGDTLNKVGSYSLALCAMYHGIPFYVAAPIHSIDLSLSTGQRFIIVEGPKGELLDDEPGICVWNPFFDITPANLITGIITEKGVIEKINAFDIKDFIEKKMGSLH